MVANWTTGQKGRVYTPYKSDGDYSAAAELVRDCPADSARVRVRLLEPFYCLDRGEKFTTRRELFRPDTRLT